MMHGLYKGKYIDSSFKYMHSPVWRGLLDIRVDLKGLELDLQCIPHPSSSLTSGDLHSVFKDCMYVLNNALHLYVDKNICITSVVWDRDIAQLVAQDLGFNPNRLWTATFVLVEPYSLRYFEVRRLVLDIER